MDKDEKQSMEQTMQAIKFEEDMRKVTWVLENFDKISLEEQLVVLSAVTDMKDLILPIFNKYHEGALNEKANMLAKLLSIFKRDEDED